MTADIQRPRGIWLWIISVVAVGFGLLTIKQGGTILFGDEAASVAAGNYVPFILVFNFMAGFVYVVAGVALWMQRRWAVGLAVSLAAATAFMCISVVPMSCAQSLPWAFERSCGQ